MTDATNKVKFGLCNVHYAMIESIVDRVVTYAAPKPWPGAVNLSLPPQGETSKFYADDIAYWVSSTNDGYQGDFESALVPDDFSQEALGEQLVAEDNVLVENASVEGKAFALLFEFKGDKKAIRHVLYNCTAARANVAGGTVTSSKTPTTSSLTLTAAPLANGNVKAKTTATTTDEVYNNWYQNVWQPPAQAEVP
ncbi:MAG: major tail protein [Lawsonibacter sp.]|jgi:phi13 family phage major tail protein